MKRHRSKLPPNSISRLGSLLHRLQMNPGKEEGTYLDQLMIFLENPPESVPDRWKMGAEMCSKWGIACTGASVWRLYRSHVFEWRLRVAHEAGVGVTESAESLAEKTAHMAAVRTLEIMANSCAPEEALVGLARIEFKKKALEFSRQKHADNQGRKLERAFAALAEQIGCNHEALDLWEKLHACLCPYDDLPKSDSPDSVISGSDSPYSPDSVNFSKDLVPNPPEAAAAGPRGGDFKPASASTLETTAAAPPAATSNPTQNSIAKETLPL